MTFTGKTSSPMMSISIVSLIQDSDVIVLATPVYFYTMSGMMKTFIDRMTPYFSGFDAKDFYFFLTAPVNRSEMEEAVNSLTGFDGFAADQPCRFDRLWIQCHAK